MSDKNIGEQNDDSDTTDTTSGAAPKTYTEKEVNDLMARTKSAIERKFAKKYEDLGDPEELRALKTTAEKTREEQALKRGEFDRILQETAAKKDAEIQKRDSIIREYKIDLPLIQAAAEFKSVSPEQVKALLKGQIKLNEEGEVEVIDQKGVTRYSDKGTPLTARDAVKEFLDSNPHFVQPGPAGSNSKTSFGQSVGADVDVSKMTDAQYKEYRIKSGIAH